MGHGGVDDGGHGGDADGGPGGVVDVGHGEVSDEGFGWVVDVGPGVVVDCSSMLEPVDVVASGPLRAAGVEVGHGSVGEGPVGGEETAGVELTLHFLRLLSMLSHLILLDRLQ